MAVPGQNNLLASLGATDEFGQLAFGVGDGYPHATPLPIVLHLAEKLDHHMVHFNKDSLRVYQASARLPAREPRPAMIKIAPLYQTATNRPPSFLQASA
jgi:hypothetical protein